MSAPTPKHDDGVAPVTTTTSAVGLDQEYMYSAEGWAGAGTGAGTVELEGEGREGQDENKKALDRRIRRKVDLRLCTIAGLLCALDLIDSGIMSSASATTMPDDLGLRGDRYAMAIWIFTLAQALFKLPATVAMRLVGPPAFFSVTTVLFGLITLCSAYVVDWRQMIALRFLMGVAMAGIYPGLTYLISAW